MVSALSAVLTLTILVIFSVLIMPGCRFCAAEFLENRECIQHEIAFHQFEPNFTIKCDFKNCPATFKVVSSFRSHRSRHKTELKSDDLDQPLDPVQPDDGANNHNFDQDLGDRGNDEDLMDIDVVEAIGDVPLKEVSAKYLLYVRANSSMPLAVLSNTMQHTQTLVSASCAQYAQELKAKLVQQGVVPEEFEMPGPSAPKVFEGLESTYLQDKYFDKSLNVIQPQSIPLDAPAVAMYSGSSMAGNRAVKLKVPHLVYIPIIETVKSLLSDRTMVRLMSEDQPNAPGWHKSYLDGELYQNSQFFKDHPDALRLILYYDELELCELAGSRTASVGALYMALDNIPAKYRSRLQFIHLVALAEKKYIHASGIDSYLEPAVLDVKKLESGIIAGDKTVYGTVIAFTGDNLASHQVGGFKEGFTAEHCCRTCIAPLSDVRTCADITKFVLRSMEMYEDQIRQLNEARTKQRRRELSVQFGLNREIILNRLGFFSAVKNFPPDAMHDLFHGSFPFTTEILLKKLIESRVVTLAEINAFIQDFDYGYLEITSKPAPILPQHLEPEGGLNQSASEMWQLAFMLPLLIGPRMDVDSDLWNVYLCLLQVSMIIMAGGISADMLAFLDVKLTEYAEGFLRCYRNTLKPKQHYLLHYVHYILQYGPIGPLWNMRMEARHQPFKRLAEKMKIFKNIALSLAKRNQLWEASQRFSEHFQQVDVTQCDVGVRVAAISCDYKNILPDNMDFVIQVPHVEVNSMVLTALECCVAINFDFEKSLSNFCISSCHHYGQ